jgi:hypothetical protein
MARYVWLVVWESIDMTILTATVAAALCATPRTAVCRALPAASAVRMDHCWYSLEKRLTEDTMSQNMGTSGDPKNGRFTRKRALPASPLVVDPQ